MRSGTWNSWLVINSHYSGDISCQEALETQVAPILILFSQVRLWKCPLLYRRALPDHAGPWECHGPDVRRRGWDDRLDICHPVHPVPKIEALMYLLARSSLHMCLLTDHPFLWSRQLGADFISLLWTGLLRTKAFTLVLSFTVFCPSLGQCVLPVCLGCPMAALITFHSKSLFTHCLSCRLEALWGQEDVIFIHPGHVWLTHNGRVGWDSKKKSWMNETISKWIRATLTSILNYLCKMQTICWLN